MVTAEDLVGTYVGRGQDAIDRDGKVTKPALREGPPPSRLVYTKEGLIIVVSTPAGRTPCGVGDIGRTTPEDRARIAEGVVAYAGRWELKDGKVHHHIEVSLLPDWVGRTNVRTPSFEGNLLTLTTEPDAQGVRQRIYWEKVSGV